MRVRPKPMLFDDGHLALVNASHILVSRHGSYVGLRWPSERIAAVARLAIKNGMGRGGVAGPTLRHQRGQATLAVTKAVRSDRAQTPANTPRTAALASSGTLL